MPKKEAGNGGISFFYDLMHVAGVLNKMLPAVFLAKIAADTVFAYAFAVRSHVCGGNGDTILI